MASLPKQPWFRWMLIVGVTDGLRQYYVGLAPLTWRWTVRHPGRLLTARNGTLQKAGTWWIAIGPVRFCGPYGVLDFASYKQLMGVTE